MCRNALVEISIQTKHHCNWIVIIIYTLRIICHIIYKKQFRSLCVTHQAKKKTYWIIACWLYVKRIQNTKIYLNHFNKSIVFAVHFVFSFLNILYRISCMWFLYITLNQWKNVYRDFLKSCRFDFQKKLMKNTQVVSDYLITNSVFPLPSLLKLVFNHRKQRTRKGAFCFVFSFT